MKVLKPVFRRVKCDIADDCTCPMRKTPVNYLTWNNERPKTQISCKVCQTRFSSGLDIYVNPFTDNYEYKVGNVLTSDEIYIKIRGVKGYIWFIIDAPLSAIKYPATAVSIPASSPCI